MREKTVQIPPGVRLPGPEGAARVTGSPECLPLSEALIAWGTAIKQAHDDPDYSASKHWEMSAAMLKERIFQVLKMST